MSRMIVKRLVSSGAVMTALCAVAWVLSLLGIFAWLRPSQDGAATLEFRHGCIAFTYQGRMEYPASLERWRWIPWRFRDRYGIMAWHLWPMAYSGGTRKFHITSWAFPLWIPLVAVGAPTFALVRATRTKPSGCTSCGYDLTVVPSPTCPECGKSAA